MIPPYVPFEVIKLFYETFFHFTSSRDIPTDNFQIDTLYIYIYIRRNMYYFNTRDVCAKFSSISDSEVTTVLSARAISESSRHIVK